MRPRLPPFAGPEPGTPVAQVPPIAYLAFVIFAWGGNYTWVKLALADGGPWSFNAWRYLIATAVLGGVLLIANGPRKVLPHSAELGHVALIGVLQVALMTGGTTLALQYIDASRGVLIAYSMPFWGMVLAFLMLGERPTRLMLAGLVVGITGLCLLFTPWAMDWTSGTAITGSLIALGATISWALGSVLFRMRRWRSGFWQHVFGQLAAGMCLIVPAALFFESRHTDPTFNFLAVVIWSAIGPSIFGFWCWARALDRIPVASASQVLLLSPVFGVFLSALVLGEPLRPALVAATALIVLGAFLSYWRGPRRSQPPTQS